MKKNILSLIAILMVVILSSSQVLATSTKLKELEEQAKAQEEQLKDLAKTYDEMENRVAETSNRIKSVHKNVKNLEIEIATITDEIETIELNLELKQEEIIEVQAELEQIRQEKAALHEVAKKRIRVMYEYGDTGFLEVLFDAKDLHDLFSRMEYIKRIIAKDKELFTGLEEVEADISAREAELEVHEANLNHLIAEAELEKNKLENTIVSKNLEIASYEEDKELYLEQMAFLEEEEARVDEELARTLKEKAAEIERLAGLTYNGGPMNWPVPGWFRLSSPFGPRFHPIHKVWKNHNGIDIPASGGTPIVATAKGEVVIAQYSSSYGNYVAITHGSGYVTLYAHCSSLLVKVGDQVKVGDTIAKVGSTGWSTGNHLHFGVQKDGIWIDPMTFLK